MPFKSKAQRRYMHARHPEIAKRWRKESGPQRDLPERKKTDRRQKLITEFLNKQRHGR